MKAREIRARLQGKADPEIIVCLTALAESLSSQQQEIIALAEIQNKAMDLLLQLGATTDEKHYRIDWRMALAELQNKAMDVILQLGATTEAATNAVDEVRGIRGNE